VGAPVVHWIVEVVMVVGVNLFVINLFIYIFYILGKVAIVVFCVFTFCILEKGAM
jgi:hypothetical protein